MAGKKKKKPMTKFPRRMQKKLLVMFGVVSFMLIFLIGRLMYIEHTSGEKYEKIVLSQQEYDSQTIPYQRGDIVDTKGTVLATSIAVYNVILDCSVLTSDEEYIDPTIRALVQCFPELTEDELYGYVREDPESRYIVLKKKASYEEIQPFVELQEAVDEKDNKVNPNIKGVWFEKEYQREYPYDALASAVIGFTAAGNVGVNGLENYYNSTLNGIDGREYGYLNTDNNFEKTIQPAVNGNNIVSTIDVNIQAVVEQKIAEFNEAYTNNFREGDAGATHIGVVIMDPNNGDVLAMANYPNYDLSNPRDLSAYYTEEELAAMDEETKMDELNKLWQNFCVTYTYEPGSTFKIITATAALEEGVVGLEDTFFCPGYKMVEDRRIRCAKTTGHGAETFETGIMNSCNPVFIELGERLGVDNYYKYFNQFGLTQKTTVDLPGEAATIMHKKENVGPVELATISFGQSFQITPIQLVTTVSSIINGGTRVTPHFGVEIRTEDGTLVEKLEYETQENICSEETSETMQYLLEKVVSEGGGKNAKIEGYSIGGKTATSQTLPRSANRYISSFLGFAPADDPKVLVLALINNPQGTYYGGLIAAPVVREIMENILPYLDK